MLMDAMKLPTPKLRIVFALVLGARYVVSLAGRSTRVLPAEQRPILPSDTTFEGLGKIAGQQFIVSMDWAIASLLVGALASTVFEPNKLALVKLRTDALGYFNWRDGFMAQMAVQSRQRDAWFTAQRRHAAARLQVKKVRHRTSESPTGRLSPLRRITSTKRLPKHSLAMRRVQEDTARQESEESFV